MRLSGSSRQPNIGMLGYKVRLKASSVCWGNAYPARARMIGLVPPLDHSFPLGLCYTRSLVREQSLTYFHSVNFDFFFSIQEYVMAHTYEFKKLGFIGLGAMGRPMLEHLANKLPSESRIWVYDVFEKVVDELCSQYPDRVLKGKSAKDVAQQVVCTCSQHIFTGLMYFRKR